MTLRAGGRRGSTFYTILGEMCWLRSTLKYKARRLCIKRLQLDIWRYRGGVSSNGIRPAEKRKIGHQQFALLSTQNNKYGYDNEGARSCNDRITLPQNKSEKPKSSKFASVVPGLFASATVMQFGFMSAEYLGQCLLTLQGISGSASPISGIPVSILLGLLLRNTITLPQSMENGIKFATKPVLQAGIICVGAKLSAVDMASVGLIGLPVVCLSVGVGMTFIPWFGRKMGLPHKMNSLIAAGTSICGITAITALSPAIKASQRDTSFAVANVVAFGTLGMLIYPYVAHALLHSSQQIGIFLGIAVHDTSQVIGTALSYSSLYNDETVLKVATITKLTRNLFLAGVIPYLTYTTAMHDRLTIESKSNTLLPTFSDLNKYFPGFILGFIGMSVLRSVGDMTLESHGLAFNLIDTENWKTIVQGVDVGSHYLLGTAMAAVGLSTSAASLKGVGVKPFVVGLVGAGAVCCICSV